MRDKNEGMHRGGGREDTCDQKLVQEFAEGRTSYVLSSKVKVMFKKYINS